VGGGIGYYMDAQEAKLRKQLRDSGVRVERDGDNINLIMPGNITFASNSADIKADFFSVMNAVALVINEFDKTLVFIAGHTDSVGSDSDNQILSQRRAEAVARYFASQEVASIRLESVGFGEQRPVADNSSKAGKQQNRRVEITLLPAESLAQ
jgi:outer membrane protein OmpA-like peptidoglycan-associated protein